MREIVWVVRGQPDTPSEYSVEGVFSSEARATAWVEGWLNKGKWPDGSSRHCIEAWEVDPDGEAA